MVLLISSVVAVVAVVLVPPWLWRMQTRAVGALVPGADFEDVAALADIPVVLGLSSGPPPLIEGPPVVVLSVIRETASLFVSYQPVLPDAAPVRTLLLDLSTSGKRELAVLDRWQAARTPVLVGAGLLLASVALQEPMTRLTITFLSLG